MHSDRKNSTWLAIQYIVTLVFSLVALKLNLLNYGEKTFGVWIILASVWGFSSTIDFGFGTAIVKYVAQFKEDKRTVNKILSSVFFVFVVLGILIFLICVAVAYSFYFNSRFIPADRLPEFQKLFFILGISFLLQYNSIFFKSLLEGLNNFTVTSLALIVQYSLILAGAVVLYIFKLNLLWLSVVYLITSLTMLSAYLLYYVFQIKIYSIKFSLFSWKEAKKIFSFSFSVQLTSVFNALIDPVVKYLIGNFYSVNSVAAYEIARKFALAISGLFFNAFRIILPKASALKNISEINYFISNYVFKYSRYGVAYSGLAFGIFLFPILLLINLTFGINESLIIFMILALPESINNFGYSIYNFLIGVGRVKLLAFIQFNNLIFVTVGLIVGFHFFGNSFGLLGYFLSVIIANILMVWYVSTHWDVKIKIMLLESKLLKLFILVFSMCLTAILINYEKVSLYIILPIFSISMFFVFYGDLKEIMKYILEPVISRNRGRIEIG